MHCIAFQFSGITVTFFDARSPTPAHVGRQTVCEMVGEWSGIVPFLEILKSVTVTIVKYVTFSLDIEANQTL